MVSSQWSVVSSFPATDYWLSLLFRNRLRAIRLGVIFGLGFCGIELGQVVAGCSDIVPAAVLEIDQGFVVEIDSDDSADDSSKQAMVDI